MNLAIENIENLSEGVRDVLRRECAHAQSLIGTKSKSAPHETVHEVRKSFKKIRGVLRLVRDATDQYHDENRFFRDEARKISDVRDAQALLEALDILEEQYGDKLYKKAFADFRKVLLDHRNDLEKKVLKESGTPSEIRQQILPKCQTLQGLSLKIEDFEPLGQGVRRTFKRGRRAYAKALGSKSPENFHEWRKRVKYLRYQLLAIAPIWPNMLLTWEDELHHLSDFLGTDRDLFMLLNFLNGESDRSENEENRYLLRNLIDGHRKQLQEHALSLGRRLYHPKPIHFVSLLNAAWDSRISASKKRLMPPDILQR